MDNDSKLEQYVLLAKGLRGLALRDLIAKATAEPGLFTFGELLCLPAVQEVRGRSAAPSIETCPPPPLCRRPTCCLPPAAPLSPPNMLPARSGDKRRGQKQIRCERSPQRHGGIHYSRFPQSRRNEGRSRVRAAPRVRALR